MLKSRHTGVFAFRFHLTSGRHGRNRTHALGLSSTTPYPLSHCGRCTFTSFTVLKQDIFMHLGVLLILFLKGLLIRRTSYHGPFELHVVSTSAITAAVFLHWQRVSTHSISVAGILDHCTSEHNNGYESLLSWWSCCCLCQTTMQPSKM